MKRFDITLDLITQMHIGHHQLGFIKLTRRYVPARVMTHAMTAVITQFLFDRPHSSDFLQIVLPFVKKRLKFTYFFISSGSIDYLPRYSESGLYYGDMTEPEFSQCFIHSVQSTAIDYALQSAREATLHEMEFISPSSTDGEKTKLKGYLFVNEGDDGNLLLMIEAGDIVLKHDSRSVTLSEVFNHLQLGGERKYGCGRVRLSADLQPTDRTEMFNTGYTVDYTRDSLIFSVSRGDNLYLPAHLKLESDLSPLQSGAIEPVVGREYKEDNDETRKGFGLKLTPGEVAAVPGSYVSVAVGQKFAADDDGMWHNLQ